MAAPTEAAEEERYLPPITAEELQALHMPISRRSEEMIDQLLAMVKRSGFPVAQEQEAAARLMCSILTAEDLDEGEVLFEEGSEGSNIWLVLSGSVHVRKKALQRPVTTVTRGKIFGEMALLHSDPVRHSSIVGAEHTQLARMDATDLVNRRVDLSLFQDAEQYYKDMQDRHDAEAAEAAGALANMSLAVRKVMVTTKKPSNERSVAELDSMLVTMKSFKLFDEHTGKKFMQNVSQRRAVCAVLHCRTFEPGRCVCAEGEEGNTMYIVLYGRLAVSTTNKAGESQHLNDLVQGQDFGELALLGDNTRTATVVASEFSVLLELQRPDYDATFRQADEEEIIEKVQNLTVCPLFNNMPLKKVLRIAYGSKIMTFSKDQTILTEGVKSAYIYFVISGLVAVSTVCRTPSQSFLVSLGNRQSGSVLGIETALNDGQSNFTYVALSEVRLLACQSVSLTRRCTKEFAARMAEYAEACLSPAAVNRMVLVETDWIKTRNQQHLAATGLRPMPPPSLADDESRQGGAALRMASAQSLATLVPQSMASLSASIGQMTPRNRAAGSVASGSETPRLPLIGRGQAHDSADGGQGSIVDEPVVSEASRALLNTMEDAEVEIETVDRGMKDLKDRMGSLIELRDEQSGRSTPTPKDIAELPGEAYRRSLQMRLWDPLVRLNHLGRSEKQKEKEAVDSNNSVTAAAALAHKEAALGGAPVVDVDLSRRLPKQFGMFTEMVYGVTVLWATVTCNTSGMIPGLAWHYFTNRLFRGFEEQAQMRGLMRSENRGVSDESSFILVGGMPHTKSYSQKSDGTKRAAGLVCDVAMRMIEDVEASNKNYQNMLIEQQHKAAIANSTGQAYLEPESPRYGDNTRSPLASPRANGDAKSQSDAGDHKAFDVSVRIGISSGSVAINVFGTKSPVYFGACGSEVDTARLLALAQLDVGNNGAGSVDDDDTASAHGSHPDGDHLQGTAASSIGTVAVLSDSANELVQDGYFTAEAKYLQKVDAQGNAQDASAATGDKPATVGNGSEDALVLSGWTLTGKKEVFDVGAGTATAAATAGAASASLTTQERGAQEVPNLATGTESAVGGGAVGTADNVGHTRGIPNSNGVAAKAVRSRSTASARILPPSKTNTFGTSGAVSRSNSPRRAEHMFRAAQSERRASARCTPAARQMLSPRILSARLRPTASPWVRPSVRVPVGARSRRAALDRPRPSLRVVSPMSLYGRRPSGLDAGGL